jgi:hypothetical protein
MRRLQGKLTYSNVMVTILAFVVLSGGAAYAASHLGKKTVGAKQLKPNAVTTAKIKKNAVTKAKIATGAVDSTKIADGSVTGTDINTASTPFSRVVQKTRGIGAVSVPKGGLTVYPLPSTPFSYTQEAGSNDTYVGALDVTFKPTCTAPRTATGFILVDPQKPKEPSAGELASLGQSVVVAGGEASTQVNIAPYITGGVRFEPNAPTNHALYLAVEVECAGGTEGATATSGAIDVIGTK